MDKQGAINAIKQMLQLGRANWKKYKKAKESWSNIETQMNGYQGRRYKERSMRKRKGKHKTQYNDVIMGNDEKTSLMAQCYMHHWC